MCVYVCVCVCVCVRLVGALMPDCVGSVANRLGYLSVLLYLPPLLVSGYFLFEVYIPVNHGLLLARLTLV